MSITKVRSKNGQVYLYESTAQWVPELKQSRPKKRYLGRLDPETGKLIPAKSTGKSRDAAASPDAAAAPLEEIRQLKAENHSLKEALEQANQEISRLSSALAQYQKAVAAIAEQVQKLSG